MYVSMCCFVHMSAGALSGQKRALGPPGADATGCCEVPEVVLRTELRSSAREVWVLNHWATPDPDLSSFSFAVPGMDPAAPCVLARDSAVEFRPKPGVFFSVKMPALSKPNKTDLAKWVEGCVLRPRPHES